MTIERDLREVLAIPLFEGLDAEARATIASAARAQQFRAKEVLIEEGCETEDLVLLVEGEVEVRRQGRLQAMIAAPEVVGLLALMEGARRSATVAGFSSGRVFRVERRVFHALVDASPAFRHNLLRHLASTINRLYDQQFETLLSFDDFFESPNAMLVPGPYDFDPYPALYFVIEQEPERLAKLLPPGLFPVPGIRGRYLLVFSSIQGCGTSYYSGEQRRFDYQEVTPFIPCIGDDGRAGVYVPELYPDAYLAILLGREMYGFPKRYGRTVLRPHSADLILSDELLIRARWSGRRQATAAEFGTALSRAFSPAPQALEPISRTIGHLFSAMNGRSFSSSLGPVVFVRKRLIGERSLYQRVWRVDELIEIPFELRQMSDFEILDEPAVAFFDPRHFLGGRCVGAVAARMGFGFGAGRLRRSYLDEPATGGVGGLWRRIARR